jgi:hypothetical protein
VRYIDLLRFVDAKGPDFILDKGYQNDIPADGLAPYANRIWVFYGILMI